MTKLYITLAASAIFFTGMLIGELIRWMDGGNDNDR